MSSSLSNSISRLLALSGAVILFSCRVAQAQDAQCELLPAGPGDADQQRATIKIAPFAREPVPSFSVYLLPAGEKPAARFRVKSVFPWASGDACLLQIRGWPQDVSGAVDLVVEAQQPDGAVLSFRVEKALTIAERRVDGVQRAMDVALLVDDSYSMRRTDPNKLRITAVQTFAGMAAARPDVGAISLISFTYKAQLLLPPTPPQERESLDAALRGLKAEGKTDMDVAFKLAARVLGKTANARKIAIVLSDGRDEPGRYLDTHGIFAAKGWPVYTIGLSEEADVETLRKIARETGGKFFFALTADELPSIFQDIALSIHRTVRIADWQVQPGRARSLPVDDSISLVTFGLSRPGAGSTVSVASPDGETTRVLQAGGETLAEIVSPPRGIWKAEGAGGGTLSVTASSDLEFDAYPPAAEATCGNPVEAACLLVRGGAPVTGACVLASFEGQRGRTDVSFYDDGRHGDGRAADGIYGGVLVPESAASTCKWTFVATGRTAAGFAFERSAALEFKVAESTRRELWLQPATLAMELFPGERKKGEVSAAGRGRVTVDIRLPGGEGSIEGVCSVREADLPPEGTLRIPFEIVAATNCRPGKYEGSLAVAMGDTKKEVPIIVTVLVPAPVVQPEPIAPVPVVTAPPPVIAPVAEEPRQEEPVQQEPATKPPQDKVEVAQKIAAPAGLVRAWQIAVAALLTVILAVLTWLLLARKTALSPFARCAFASSAGHALALLLVFNIHAQNRPATREEAPMTLDIKIPLLDEFSGLSDLLPQGPEIPVKEMETSTLVERKAAESGPVAERMAQRPDAEAGITALEMKKIEHTPEPARRDIDLSKTMPEQIQAQEKIELKEKLAGKPAGVDAERRVEPARPSALDGNAERLAAETRPPAPRAAERAAAALSMPADAPLRLNQDMSLAKRMNAPTAQVEDRLAVDAHAVPAEGRGDLPAQRAGLARSESPSIELPRSGVIGPEAGTARTSATRGIGSEERAGIAALSGGIAAKQAPEAAEIPADTPLMAAAKKIGRLLNTMTSGERGVFAGRPETKSAELRLVSASPAADATNLSPVSASMPAHAGGGPGSGPGRQVALVPSGVSKSAFARAGAVSVDEPIAGSLPKSAETRLRESGPGFVSVGKAETAGVLQPGTGALPARFTPSPGAVSQALAPAGVAAAPAAQTGIRTVPGLSERSAVAARPAGEIPGEELTVAAIRRENTGRGEAGSPSALSVGRVEAIDGPQPRYAMAVSGPLPAASSGPVSRPLAQLTVAEAAGGGGAARIAEPALGKRTTSAMAAEETGGGGETPGKVKRAEKAGTGEGARVLQVSGASGAGSPAEEARGAAGSVSAAPRIAMLQGAKTDLKPQAQTGAVAPRLSFSIRGTGKGARTASLTISLARHSGDWDCSPTAMMYLAHQLQERTGMAIETSDRVLSLASPDLMRVPFVYMTGHKDFVFSEAEVQNLRKYVEAGGSIWGDDCTDFGDETFDTAFRREIARVLPDGKLAKLGMDFHGYKTGYDLTKGYKGYAIPPGDKYRLDYLEGIPVGDRIAVIYSRNDYGDGLNINPDTHPLKPSLTDLPPNDMQEGAVRMGINLILYFVTSGGKAEAEFLGATSTTLRETAKTPKQTLPQGETRVVDAMETPEGWTFEKWSDAGKVSAGNRRVRLEFTLGDKKKTAFTKKFGAPLQLSRADSLVIDAESRLRAGARLAIGITAGNRYYETQPFYLKPGANTAFFRMAAKTFKNEETNWEHKGALGLPVTVDRVSLLIYSPSPGEIVFQNLRVVREK